MLKSLKYQPVIYCREKQTKNVEIKMCSEKKKEKNETKQNVAELHLEKNLGEKKNRDI